MNHPPYLGTVTASYDAVHTRTCLTLWAPPELDASFPLISLSHLLLLALAFVSARTGDRGREVVDWWLLPRRRRGSGPWVPGLGSAAWPMGSEGFVAAAAACPAAAEAFAKYYGIVSGGTNVKARQGLVELSQAIDGIKGMRDAIFADVPNLMPFIDLEDTCLFSCFYDFVFFICREKGQKSITIQRAVAAWKIVLNGRFRLLDRWCNFVEKYQRHNISEDTWQQLLAFSRCVNEDLEGYDPRGAWPVLIDDFVEQMHRIYHSTDCSSAMESQCTISSTFKGLDLLPGSKRKCPPHFRSNEEDVELSDSFTRSVHLTPIKRLKERHGTSYGVGESHKGTHFSDSSSDYREDTNLHNPRGCLQNSPCNVEDALSKGFEGCISMKCSF